MLLRRSTGSNLKSSPIGKVEHPIAVTAILQPGSEASSGFWDAAVLGPCYGRLRSTPRP